MLQFPFRMLRGLVRAFLRKKIPVATFSAIELKKYRDIDQYLKLSILNRK